MAMVISLDGDHDSGEQRRRRNEGSESESVNEEREHERNWIGRGEEKRRENSQTLIERENSRGFLLLYDFGRCLWEVKFLLRSVMTRKRELEKEKCFYREMRILVRKRSGPSM